MNTITRWVLPILALVCYSLPVHAQLPHTESFETDGDAGARYLSNTHDDGAAGNDFFVRHDFGTTNPNPNHGQQIFSVDGNFGWAGEDVDTADNPLGSGNPAILRLNDLTVTNFNNLQVEIGLACSSPNTSGWETDDFIRVQAAFDGNSGGTSATVTDLNLGTYTTVGEFRGVGGSAANACSTIQLNGAGAALTNTLTDYTFTISNTGGLPDTGNILSVQVVVSANGGNEEFAFDNIRITGDSALPVELTSFQAQATGNEVFLTWQTASEDQNAGFEVQHQQADGAPFQTVGFVEGAGTTRVAQRYTYQVADLLPGTHRFRLKQVDLDGGFSFSEVVEAMAEVPGTHMLGAAYPNPFNPQTRFTLAVGRDQHVDIEVYNLLGKRLSVLHTGTLTADKVHTFTLDGVGLPSGVYLYQVTGEQFRETRRVMLVK